MLDLVSVIIPIYNVFPYLDRCLETVVNQTYKNMEIILIDDGSTDSSLEKCLDWKKKDSRIVLITKQNEGPGITRNLGIKAAHGDYVVFVDADDYIDLTLVEKLHHSVKKYNSEMAFCDIYNVSGNEKHVLIFNVDIKATDNFWKNRLLLTEMPVYLWGKIFHRKMLLENELWMTEHYVQDIELLPKLLSVCRSISQVREPLCYHVQDRPGRITTSKREQIIRQMPEIFDSIIQFIKSKNLYETMKEDLEIYIVSKYLRLFYQDIEHMLPYPVAMEEELKQKIECKLQQYFSPSWKKRIPKNKEHFLLWGSPSLKSYVIKKNIASYMISGNFLIRYHFSSLISSMQEKTRKALECQNANTDNPYRKNMIEKDIHNVFFTQQDFSDIDYVMIDFLEERYDIVECGGNYYTNCSDFQKLEYTKRKDFRILKRNSQEVTDLWKTSCDKFINVLKKYFTAKNVCLVKQYVHSGMRDYDCSCDEHEINVILGRYYQYFEENFSGINCIAL